MVHRSHRTDYYVAKAHHIVRMSLSGSERQGNKSGTRVAQGPGHKKW